MIIFLYHRHLGNNTFTNNNNKQISVMRLQNEQISITLTELKSLSAYNSWGAL